MHGAPAANLTHSAPLYQADFSRCAWECGEWAGGLREVLVGVRGLRDVATLDLSGCALAEQDCCHLAALFGGDQHEGAGAEGMGGGGEGGAGGLEGGGKCSRERQSFRRESRVSSLTLRYCSMEAPAAVALSQG